MATIQDVTLENLTLSLHCSAYGDWIANIFDADVIQASGVGWTPDSAVTAAQSPLTPHLLVWAVHYLSTING